MASQRREKKRQHDREAQRAARDKNKRYIAHLEGLVKTLQAANSSPKRMEDMLNQLATGHKTINTLRTSLARINNIVKDAVSYDSPHGDTQDEPGLAHKEDTTAASPMIDQSMPLEEVVLENEDFGIVTTSKEAVDDIDSVRTQVDSEARRLGIDPVTSENIDTSHTAARVKMHTDLYDDITADLDLAFWSPSTGQHFGQDSMLNEEQHNLIHDSATPAIANFSFDSAGDQVREIASTVMGIKHIEGRFWFLAGTILGHILSLEQDTTTPRVLDDDIVIRSCMHGWDSVEHLYRLDVGWKWLKQLDQLMYSHLGSATRMAILRIMRMQYLVRIADLLVQEFL